MYYSKCNTTLELMKVLITGTNSGLGKWLSRQFPYCDKFTRGSLIYNDDEYDLIIHCAASVSHSTWKNFELDLFEDNVLLTRDLALIPHNKFVYISSIDVDKNTPYSISKKMSELVVKELCSNYLILRPSGLIGDGMRENTFKKIVNGKNILLTKDSTVNYVLYEDVLRAIEWDTGGTKTLSSNESITIKEVVDIFNNNISYGKIHYEVDCEKSDVDTKKTSKDNVIIYRDKYVK